MTYRLHVTRWVYCGVVGSIGMSCRLIDVPARMRALCIRIVGNRRSLCANLAAANTFKKAHIDTEPVASAIEEAQFYYISSFFLTVPEGPDTLLAVAKHVESSPERNKQFMMNLGAEFLMQFFQDKFQVSTVRLGSHLFIVHQLLLLLERTYLGTCVVVCLLTFYHSQIV